MRTVEYRGVLTALSSLTNTGRDSGTIHRLRTEMLVRPDGQIVPALPVISGSVIRGHLRRVAAAMVHSVLVLNHIGPSQNGTLPWSVVHAFRTGGALRETRTSGEVLTAERQAVLRDAFPFLGLFGVSAGARIMSGRLIVDKAIPVAQETDFLIPHSDLADALNGYHLSTVNRLVQREGYRRVADVHDAATSPLISPVEGGVADGIAKGSGHMVWGQETLVTGTRLLHSLIAENATPAEVSFFDNLLEVWSANARIGGQKGRGMGRVACGYTRLCTDAMGAPARDEPATDWEAALIADRLRAGEALSWLT